MTGAVARTALSLLGLGLGSAVFGALVVGPAIGKTVAQDNSPSHRGAGSGQADRERLLRDALGLHHSETAAGTRTPARTEEGHVRLTSSEVPASRRSVARDEEPERQPVREADATSERTNGSRSVTSSADEERTTPAEAETPRKKTTSRREEADSSEEDAPRAKSTREKHVRRTVEPDEPVTHPIVSEPSEPRAAAISDTRRTERHSTHEDATPSRKHDEDVRVADAAPAETETEGAKLYRVRVGKFESREDAEKLRDELKQTAGVTAFLVKVPDGYRVQTGAYKHRSNAEKIAGNLRSHSYRPQVTQE